MSCWCSSRRGWRRGEGEEEIEGGGEIEMGFGVEVKLGQLKKKMEKGISGVF